jgi:hypothetical protein
MNAYIHKQKELGALGEIWWMQYQQAKDHSWWASYMYTPPSHMHTAASMGSITSSLGIIYIAVLREQQKSSISFHASSDGCISLNIFQESCWIERGYRGELRFLSYSICLLRNWSLDSIVAIRGEIEWESLAPSIALDPSLQSFLRLLMCQWVCPTTSGGVNAYGACLSLIIRAAGSTHTIPSSTINTSCFDAGLS